MINAIIYLFIVCLLISSVIYPYNKKIANAICILTIIKNVLPFYDIESKNKRNDSVQNGLFLSSFSMYVIILLIAHNLINTNTF